MDDQDQEVPKGTVGEIVARGKKIMKGYWNKPEATVETLRGGWLHTGDLASMDEDGYLTLAGRKKDMIIRGGENIYPVEIENVLHSHPKVLEAAVIGVPDDYWGVHPLLYTFLIERKVLSNPYTLSIKKKNLIKCSNHFFKTVRINLNRGIASQ